MNSATLAVFSLALFLCATVCYGAALFLETPAAPSIPTRKQEPLKTTLWGRVLAWGGILVLFSSIGVWCVQMHRSPFASSFGTLIVSAWSMALLYGLLELKVKAPSLGAAMLSVVCLALFWGLVHAGGPIAESPMLSQRIVSLHVLATVLSFVLFALGGVCAALYLLQHRTLKKTPANGLFRRLPPLATLDTLSYRSVAFALPFLTLGLILGIAYIYRGGVPITPNWWLDPKTVVSFATWGLYIFYFSVRRLAGWSGVKLQYVLIAGLVAAIALYLIPGTTHKFL